MKASSSLLIFSIVFVIACPAFAVTLNQVDTFDTTVLSWSGGSSSTHVPGGGPGGAGDAYLQININNFHLATHNSNQWTGNYNSAGVNAISMDLNHSAGAGPVSLRLVVYGPGGAFTSTVPTPVTSGWNSYVFSLLPADMVFLTGSGSSWPGGGTGVLSDTLANVSKLQIRNDPSVTPTPIGQHPQHITATLGIDNITAVPEPITFVLLGLGTIVIRRKL